MKTEAECLLRVRGLAKWYPLSSGLLGRQRAQVKAVDGIDFELAAGESLALVGESGCGKTTAAHALLRLIEPSAGRATYFPGEGHAPVELFDLSQTALRPWRSQLQIVFQNPLTSLNPRHSVGASIAEPLRVRGLKADVPALLERVGLDPGVGSRFPHEFSGGELQRIALARALAPKPRLLVLDEALSALDLSLQAQMLNLLMQLQADLGLAYLFISHDLSVVRHIADRVAVMYLGRVVESGTRSEIFEHPAHPYTQALLSAIPRPEPGAAKRTKSRIILSGEVPSALHPPIGCHFHARCAQAEDTCRSVYPQTTRLSTSHTAACHLLQQAPLDPAARPEQAPDSQPGGTSET
jgi:peptide/nickel transport system ATP-binding protein